MFVRVHVVPGARKESVTKVGEEEYHVAVREPAERNLANKRLCTVVARLYKTDVGHVRIVSGHRSRTKVISVDA